MSITPEFQIFRIIVLHFVHERKVFVLVLHHKEKIINSAQFIEVLKVKTTSEYTSLYI